MREIVLDTETTGLSAEAGDRIVEIGCVELVNQVRTGARFQRYLDPEREMPEGAFEIHGLSTAFLRAMPIFAAICDDFLAFIGDAPLVMHNSAFDLGFVNAELERIGRPAIPEERTVDTLEIARRKFPGAQASLDALCRRFNIDSTAREKHGALLDAELLADVYLELTGGRQPGLIFASRASAKEAETPPRARREPRPHAPTAAELRAHEALLDRIEDPIWRHIARGSGP